LFIVFLPFSYLYFVGRSMMLINSLLSHASDTYWDEFISELERLNVRRAVIVCHLRYAIFD